MHRVLLLLALFVMGPAVAEPLVGPVIEACAQPCPDDDEKGQCAPDCADCTCCGHVVHSLTPLPASDGLTLETELREHPALPQAPEDPDSHKPRHVPKVRPA